MTAALHCKPKPCKAHREIPVSQFPQGKTFFHYRAPLISFQGPCTSMLGIAVCMENAVKFFNKMLKIINLCIFL